MAATQTEERRATTTKVMGSVCLRVGLTGGGAAADDTDGGGDAMEYLYVPLLDTSNATTTTFSISVTQKRHYHTFTNTHTWVWTFLS